MQLIGLARSLPHLAELAADSPALSLDMSAALDGMQLPLRIDMQIQGLLPREGMKVREFLLRHDLHRALERTRSNMYKIVSAFQDWVERVAPPPMPPPGPQRNRVELIRATGIPDLESWNLGMLSLRMPYQLALAEVGFVARRVVLKPAEEKTLTDALRDLGARAKQLRDLPAQPLVETGEPRLDEFRRALRTLRDATREGWPPGILLPAHLLVRAEKDDLVADLSFEGDARRLAAGWGYPYATPSSRIALGDEGSPEEEEDPPHSPSGAGTDIAPKARKLREGTLVVPDLPRWKSGISLQCWCRRDACIHRAVLLDMLLEGSEKLTHEVAKVLRLLLVPAWQRALDQLSAPDAKSRHDLPGVLSFVAGRNGVDALFHVEGKKGPSKRGVAIRDGMAKLIPRLRGLDRKIAETWALAGDDFQYARDALPFYGDALLQLEGHPAVRLEANGPCVPVRVERAQVRVVETDAGVELSVAVAGGAIESNERVRGIRSSSGLLLLRPARDELRLVVLPDEVERLLSALHAHGQSFPREALPGLVGILPRLEAVTQVELPDDLKGEEQPGASKPVLRIEPAGAGLMVSLRSEPLASGPLFVPGQGGPLSASFDGTRRRFARRDFERELHEASALAAELSLDPAMVAEPFSWVLEPGDRSVEMLRRIHHLSEAGQAVEWIAPKARFSRPMQTGHLQLRIERKRDWFGLDGGIDLDERRVGLAALLEAARARRRWVQLGPGDYAELSEALLAQLTPLAHLAGPKELPTLTLGAVPLVEALSTEIQGLDAAEGWRKLTERLAEAREKPFPVPEGIRIELRDYQNEGFRWLSRLADWGAGACLADDMGLGKTVQALALLLARAPLGPSLVVAPSSMLHSWRAEANRFAPSLRLRLFHEGERALGDLSASDVVVVSWTLFARHAELFAAQKFPTAVLDEVQAIKNAGTQRAKAAHALSAGFVVALTGTPVENHLGELWSLFRAVLPSLLGSEESFRLRFASGAPEAMQALAALIQPFILRRKKSEVARELPARTEVDVLIPLSPEERALYDDVRLAAAGDLGALTGEDQRFQVLAALTRLRLVACHPKLQDPGWTGPKSKLGRLLELVRDLSAGGHRALVFSQFTKHLALVSEALRAEGVAFSYLDGGTPLAERQHLVEKFQAGQGGDLFLISLKAGGTGLTLTAADYVIHLDPWWNPAVEDQASDRAHRIGQTKPVTVYRLIAEGTIEQQILSLHREKREMVDALLAGTERAGKLSASELANLIRGG